MASTFGAHMSSLQSLMFTRNNYEYWFITMKPLFREKYVCEIVQNGYTEPEDKTSYNNLMQVEKDSLRE